MRGCISIIMFYLLNGLLLLVGCGGEQGYVDPFGMYEGNYGSINETLIINKDGTYSQNFELDGTSIFTSKGKWSKVKDKAGHILFYDYIYLFDAKTLTFKAPSNQLRTNASGTLSKGFNELVFYRDVHYLLNRKNDSVE